MTIQQFIEKAIEGGWKNTSPEGSWDDIYYILLQPDAWKAVGEVEGWGTDLWVGSMSRLTGAGLDTHKWEIPDWQYPMHRMVDALAEGKTIEQYLETL